MRVVLLAVLLVAPTVSAAPKSKRRPPPPPAANATLPPPEAADMPDTKESVSLTPTSGTPQHSEGDYSGVKPGVPPLKPGKKPAKGTLSWIGFEAKSGNAEIFLQSVAPFEVSQHVEAGALVVDLAGLDRLGQNTWREVDARFFDTPVARITAKRVGASRAHKSGIELRVTFKTPKDAHEAAMRSASEADGMYYQYLSFAGAAPEAK
ncbi:MAG TPA: hypothetical protein VGC41_24285 [Kofleriaceae bacterium]